ncbi:ribosomal protein L11 methyltransferase [Bacillus thermophilus]|uniref:Ribosomal protein L11 methyltransferase n=1 Tax=Siminovitchia thermophila TaxID=1245522 RepID=A0ABS2R9K2_9BACI|nr:50S ribosomal protein L11 methyltransferase [Siminovitchia thermophila]MBM7716317.1 ribosomal protein L11 methyltransferase [Siminovitchia thermophila]
MKWSEISVYTTNEAIEPISHIMHEAGAAGIAIEDREDLDKKREDRFGEIYELNPADFPDEGVIIKAYLPVNAQHAETVSTIQQQISKLPQYQINIGKNLVKVAEVKEEDWATAWKKYYHPVKVSERVTIVPSWEEYETGNSDELIIKLDPGMAFGTGTHPTTAMCIRALEKTVKPGDFVIDVGTGSGVLSIAASLLGAEQVTALDLDEVAVEAARQNIALNGVEDIVSARQNNLLEGIEKSADVIVANILAEVIVRFSKKAAEVCKRNGYFIVSGIILQKKDSVADALHEAGFQIEETMITEDWVAMIARRVN